MPDSRIEGAGQSKVRMMKAGLPEFQFPVATRGAVAKADDTPRRAGCVLSWGGTHRRDFLGRMRLHRARHVTLALAVLAFRSA
jgi:hypothetical protein